MPPIERILAALQERECNPRQSGGSWTASCPAHDDRRPSLSVSEGDDGRALVRCHVGCTAEAICDALGLRVSDLMPDDGSGGNAVAQRPRKAPKATSGKTTYPTAKAAIEALERHNGKRSALWVYHDANGDPVAVVIRWDKPNGKKDIRPVSRHGDRWIIGGMAEPRPLYGLPDLAGANRVYLTEGEKAADAARSIGLTATTSAHGSQSPAQTDWSPLAGKQIVILPDNDDAGRQYADTVVAILLQQTPAPTIKIIELPGLPDKGDIVDWVETHADANADDLREQVEALADKAEAVLTSWPEIVPFDNLSLPDFPTHALPDVLRQWVGAESHATQTPADLAGLLSLAVCSATIARRAEAEPRDGWPEPVNLYVAVLLPPGNRKSAVFTDAMRPLRELEAELVEAERPTVARAQSERRQSEAKLKKLEKLSAEKGDGEARHEAGKLAAELAEQPEPVLPRLIVDDATSEQLGIMLADQNGRIASMSPEGDVFDLMAGMYSKNRTPKFDVYLKGHSGDDLITDRISRESVRVERPALTCAYAMQPQVIMGLAEHAAFRGRGLLARFLYATPPSRIGRREIAPTPVSEAVRDAYRQTVRSLADSQDEFVLRFAPDASATLQDWEGEIEAMLADGGQMEFIRDWGAKLAGATVRLATVLHCVEHGPTGLVGCATIESAIEIAGYLIPHAEAVLSMMQAKEAPAEDDARYVLRWIERHGRRDFTKRDAQQQGKRRFRRADDIDPALEELTRRGYIRLRPSESTGPGRPPSPTFDVNPAFFTNENPGNRSHNSQNPAERPKAGDSENIENGSGQSENADRVQVTI